MGCLGLRTANTTLRKRRLYAVQAFASVTRWLEPPEPALSRYLLRSRRRAANDNKRPPRRASRLTLIGSGTALIGALALVVLLV